MRWTVIILMAGVFHGGSAEAKPRPDLVSAEKAVAYVSAWPLPSNQMEEGRAAWAYYQQEKLVSRADYPEGARLAGKQGVSVIAVTVGTDDKPTGCVVTETAGDDRLDAAACDAAMKRGRYRHAMDSTGNAVAGKVGYSFEWALSDPKAFPAPPAIAYPPPPTSPERRDWPRTGWLENLFPLDDKPKTMAVPKTIKKATGETGLDIAVNEDGSVKSCAATKSSGNPELDLLACSAASALRFRLDRICNHPAYCGLRTPLMVRWAGKKGTFLFPLAGKNFQRARMAKPWAPTNKDYPASALQNGQEGRVSVSLALDPQGAPMKCRIVSGSDNDALDHQTCVLALKHVRYLPFTDVFGVAIPGKASFSVNWKL